MQPKIHLQGKPEYGRVGYLGLLWRCTRIVGCIFNFSIPSGSLSLGKYPRQLFSSEILVHVNLEEMVTTGECTRITNHTAHFNNVQCTVASNKFWSSMSFQNLVRLSQI
jgi:hypothetical protein